MEHAEQNDPNGRTAKLRHFYARFVATKAGVDASDIEQAFAEIPRERFAGPAPWFILVDVASLDRRKQPTYVATPDGDPAFVYQDNLIALDPERGINTGEPSLHAICLGSLAVQQGETVLHVGAGSGYYTAILAHLVGRAGRVIAFEIDPEMAIRAEHNLADRPWVEVRATSGIADGLPKADVIYVNAGITQPSWAWLDALRPGGRLLFPLQPVGGLGGMLLVDKPRAGGLAWPARFVSRAIFIACQGKQVEATGRSLAAAFTGGGWQQVRAIRFDDRPDDTCWFAGPDWWLSTHAA